MLLDTGVSTCFVHEAWLKEAQKEKPALLEMQSLSNPQSIKVAIYQHISVHLEATGTLLLQRNSSSCNIVLLNRVRQKGARLNVTAKVMPSMMENVNLIVGMDQLTAFGAVLDCTNGMVELNDPSQRRQSSPK